MTWRPSAGRSWSRSLDRSPGRSRPLAARWSDRRARSGFRGWPDRLEDLLGGWRPWPIADQHDSGTPLPRREDGHLDRAVSTFGDGSVALSAERRISGRAKIL
jgi:hypothetical protein